MLEKESPCKMICAKHGPVHTGIPIFWSIETACSFSIKFSVAIEPRRSGGKRNDASFWVVLGLRKGHRLCGEAISLETTPAVAGSKPRRRKQRQYCISRGPVIRPSNPCAKESGSTRSFPTVNPTTWGTMCNALHRSKTAEAQPICAHVVWCITQVTLVFAYL